MTHRVKRLISSQAAGTDSADARQLYKQRRTNLGEAFGTRKAQNQIKAEERNRVDVSAMEGVKGHLMDSIVALAPVSGESSPQILRSD
jgi:DNA-directed RNA polymerase I subunit RPA49